MSQHAEQCQATSTVVGEMFIKMRFHSTNVAAVVSAVVIAVQAMPRFVQTALQEDGLRGCILGLKQMLVLRREVEFDGETEAGPSDHPPDGEQWPALPGCPHLHLRSAGCSVLLWHHRLRGHCLGGSQGLFSKLSTEAEPEVSPQHPSTPYLDTIAAIASTYINIRSSHVRRGSERYVVPAAWLSAASGSTAEVMLIFNEAMPYMCPSHHVGGLGC